MVVVYLKPVSNYPNPCRTCDIICQGHPSHLRVRTLSACSLIPVQRHPSSTLALEDNQIRVLYLEPLPQHRALVLGPFLVWLGHTSYMIIPCFRDPICSSQHPYIGRFSLFCKNHIFVHFVTLAFGSPLPVNFLSFLGFFLPS